MGNGSQTAEERARKIAKDQRGFLSHLGTYIAVGLFFLILNLITDPHNLWFFWPLLPWGVGLAIHGWNVVMDQRFDERWEDRRVEKILSRDKARAQAAPPTKEGELDQILSRSTTLIDSMRSSARRIPKPEVRDQALGVCAAADQVLAAIGDNREEVAIARDFLNRYLAPANTIVTDYARLATRNVPSARETLVKVEEHDLPLLTAKLRELYDRLHRGSLIDLEVAREMLSLDVADWQDDDLVRQSERTGNPAEPLRRAADAG